MRIITNKIKCTFCGETIESKYRHDFEFCKCGKVAVDGGKDYLRRLGKQYIELSLTEEDNDIKDYLIFVDKIEKEEKICQK